MLCDNAGGVPTALAATETPSPVATLGIIGPGLIGGSFALAMRRAGLCQRILALGNKPQQLAQAQDLGVIDAAVPIERLAQEAQLIFIAVPVNAVASVLAQLAPELSPHTLVMDGGSTKVGIIEAARQVLGERVSQFVPAHPIAGSHQSGVQAARSDLFDGRKAILTPLAENAESVVAQAAAIWQALGATVYTLTPQEHDEVFAATSHAPHLLASAYINSLLGTPQTALQLRMAGTGFKDFTRIAASSADVWCDIFMANRQAISEQISAMMEQLQEAQQYLQQGQQQELHQWIDRATQVRANWRIQP